MFFHYIRFFSRFSACLGVLMLLLTNSVLAANPYSAYYSSKNDTIFWFILITDIHIGTLGTKDSDNLYWVVTEGKNVVRPEFIVVSGDLTDSTNGNWLGVPQCGPFLSEWQEYKNILTGNVDNTNYYDIPGNHDAYCDQYFDFYLANSVQGQATSSTQISWTRDFSFGKYHFLGVNTADNTGDAFSFFWPWGDYAGLDKNELAFIQAELESNSDSDLTFVFGHHPITDTGDSNDTWLYYGASDFVSLLDQNGASLYGYGHTHRYSEVLFMGDSYTGYTSGGGIVYFNIKSLGKSSDDHFSVIAIDCNGVSTKTQTMGDWPLVLITSPVNHEIDISNPYAYSIPDKSDNPLRALVFDTNPLLEVQYRIDGGDWYAMQQNQVNPKLWEGYMDNTATAEGLHTVEVQATGSSTKSDTISIYVASSNQAPVADGLWVSTNEDTDVDILLTASDPDGDPLIYQILLQPYSGTLTGVPPNLIYSPYADYNGGDNFTFNVFDGSTYSHEASVAITVEPVNDAPVASFSYTTEGLKVNFTDNSSDIDGNIVSYSWDFGDGNTASSENPSHQYDSSGTYSVTLEVSDNEGANDNFTQDVTVGTPLQINTPTNLTADLSGNDVTLVWIDTSEGEDGFIIERAQKIKGKYNFSEGTVYTVESNTTVYLDTSVSPASYKYRVKAYKDSIESDYSNEVSVTVEAVASYCGDGTCDGNETPCSCPVDCGPPDSSESNCSDGIDNDCDGYIDCYDKDCEDDPNCMGGCLPKKAACSSDDECCSGDCLPNGVCK